MGLRFRRSIKVLPGVRLNLSKSGIGISAGVRGLRVGLDAKGRRYASAGLPGTGLSSRRYIGREPAAVPAQLPSGRQQPAIGPVGGLVLAFAAVIGAIAVFVFLFR